MILPTKGVTPQRSLLTLGGSCLELLSSTKSVSALWSDLQRLRSSRGESERVTFEWYCLTLSMLFAVGAIEETSEGWLRRSSVPAAT